MVSYGPLVSVAIDVQPFVPWRVYWNSTLLTPEPVSFAFAVSCALGPPIVWPASGSVSEPVGSVLSTSTVRVALVPVWPAWSVAIARSS